MESETVDESFFTEQLEPLMASTENKYISEMFSFKQIGSIAYYVEPISSEVTIDLVVDLFRQDPTLQSSFMLTKPRNF